MRKMLPSATWVIISLFMSNFSFGQGDGGIEWTDTEYPDYITKLTDFGERTDWCE